MNLEKYKAFPHGDMPGDKIAIDEGHVQKAELLYPRLMDLLQPQMDTGEKAVVSVCGGSGVGKSEIASLLAGMFCRDGVNTYVMSGDNYPHRIPSENDTMREQVYEKGGREALAAYLGSLQEIDFGEVNGILAQFKSGKEKIQLKRMGRTPEDIWHEDVDFSNIQVMILEWTHGNSKHLQGVDIPILLNSTPQETLEHRRKRGRDGGVDSPFTMMVLELEQEQLKQQAHKAKLIVTKSAKLISYQEYCALMGVAE